MGNEKAKGTMPSPVVTHVESVFGLTPSWDARKSELKGQYLLRLVVFITQELDIQELKKYSKCLANITCQT